jgi:hypothetical protein
MHKNYVNNNCVNDQKKKTTKQQLTNLCHEQPAKLCTAALQALHCRVVDCQLSLTAGADHWMSGLDRRWTVDSAHQAASHVKNLLLQKKKKRKNL